MRYVPLVALFLMVGIVPFGSTLVHADEGPSPFDTTGAPASPRYGPGQRLNFGEPKPGVTAIAPRTVSVFMRRLEFDLRPSTLELWIDGQEYTESLRLWEDRAWIETPPGFWSRGLHSVTAKIKDVSGSPFEQTTDFDLKAPSNLYPVPVSGSEVTNLFEDYQSFSVPDFPPYWHSGLDLRTAAGTPVLASRSGTVVKVIRYRTLSEVEVPNNYWEVAVQDTDGYIWQYHHLDHNTITVVETDVVAAGDTLGQVVEWNANHNGSLYNHVHVNVVRWLGPGPLPKPYVDGFEYFNPLLFIEQPPGADTVFPTEFEVFFTANEDDEALSVESDDGDPVLNGDIDIIGWLYDRRTEVPEIPGHPYDLGLYDLAYSVEPVSAECGMAWIPRTSLAKFDKIPGDSLVNTQEALLLEVFKEIVNVGFGVSHVTQFNYSARRLLYSMTNGFFGTIDAQKGYWNTDLQSVLGVHFPDGNYVVRLYASDFDGHELVFPIDVVVDNGLEFTGFCPGSITIGQGNDGGGPPGLVLNRAAASASSFFGSFPVDFATGIVEGSAHCSVAGGDWPVWNFDFPADNRRIAVGVLASKSVNVEYVPRLGDVILEIPAEVQSLPLAGTFNPTAPSANPVTLRLSTRLARDESNGAALIGSPHAAGATQFHLVEAAQFRLGAESMVLRTAPGGVPVSWIVPPASVHDVQVPKPLLRAFPNPFGAKLSVQITSPVARRFRVDVLSVNGRLVRTLHEGSVDKGTRVFAWDGLDHAGHAAGPGVYFVRASGDQVNEVLRTVLIR